MGCEHSVPIATAEDFQVVHPMPAILLEDSIFPGQVPGAMYHLKMNRNLWRRTYDSTSSAISYTDGRPFEARVHGVVNTVGIWPFSFTTRRLILQNSRLESIAVMMHSRDRLEMTFKLMSFKPFYYGQPPSGQVYDDGRALFPWAEVISRFGSLQFTMRTGDGTTYVADRVGKVLGQRQMKLSRNGLPCAMLREEDTYSFTKPAVWDLQIGAGIDPCMILCFAAVIDEIDEIEREENERQMEENQRRRDEERRRREREAHNTTHSTILVF